MRKPRDYDSELKALADKAKAIKERRVRQLGELVAATGADALDADMLAEQSAEIARRLDEIEAQAEAARASLPELAEPVWQAAESLREAVDWMLGHQDLNQRFAGAAPFLRGFARVLGGHFHLKAALTEAGDGPRTRLARFYITRLLPEHAGLLAHATQGATDLYALTPEDFAA